MVIVVSKLAEQDQDQENDDHKPESTSAVIARSIEGAAPEPAESAQQDDDQDDEQDGSNRHGMISLVCAKIG